MDGQILQYFGTSNASYLHAGGKAATAHLVGLVQPKEGEKILEVGCGTGTTLIEMAARSKAQLYGYDLSPTMVKKAQKRVQWCGLSRRVTVELLSTKNHFPAPDQFFDKVYAESVVGIQEGMDFKQLLQEVRRVLKPNGVLVLNETIWLDSAPKALAASINTRCKQSFGIIQANDEYTYAADWMRLCDELGFRSELNASLREFTDSSHRNAPLFSLLPSKTFTFYGKLRSLFSPTLRKEWHQYQKEMTAILGTGEPLMEGRILKMNKQIPNSQS